LSGPSTILCLDLATVTGVAEWSPSTGPRFYSVRFASPGDEHPETFGRARRWIDDRLRLSDVAAIYAEAPLRLGAAVGQTNADTVLRLTGLWAVISSAAKVWRIKYRDVNVQEARRAFIGKGQLRREEAKARVMQMARAVGWQPENLDEADAAAVLFYALTREAPGAVPAVSPMLQHQVATAAENERILREQQKRERRLRRVA
jgi:hypothetical protein